MPSKFFEMMLMISKGMFWPFGGEWCEVDESEQGYGGLDTNTHSLLSAEVLFGDLS